MKKEEKKQEDLKPADADFVDATQSEDMQKEGYKVIEMKIIDGVKKHRLEKSV